MKKINEKNILFSIIISSVILLNGCDFSDIKSKATTGELSLLAEESVEPVTLQLKSEFERLNKEAKITVNISPAKNCVADLLNNATKFIILARELDSAELNIQKINNSEITKYIIGTDGVAFIVNPLNPVERVTSEDLKKIFTGEITKWTQIKSQDEEQNTAVSKKFKGVSDNIKVFIQRPNSSIYPYVKDTVLSGLDYAKSVYICSTSVQMIQEIRKNISSIGISNANWLSTGEQEKIDSTVKPLRISRIYPNGRQDDFVEFHQGYIYNKKYPYIRKIYVYTTEFDIKLATGYVTFILSTDGQKIMLKNGLVPVNQPIRTIQLN